MPTMLPWRRLRACRVCAALLMAILAAACSRGGEKSAHEPPAVHLDAVPPQPGGPIVLASQQNFADTLIADDRALYWVARGGLELVGDPEALGVHPEATGVFRLAGHGPPVRLGDCGDATWLAQDATDLFCGDDSGTITRLPKTGGAAEQVVTGVRSLAGVAVDDTSLYYLAGAHVGVTPSPTDGSIPRADADISEDASLWRVAKRGSARPKRVASNLGIATGLIRDGDAFYVRQSWPGAIVRVPARGGAAQVVVEDAIAPEWIVARGVIYYQRHQPEGDEVVRILPGGQPQVIATSAQRLSVFAVSGDKVYFGTYDGEIVAVSAKGPKAAPTTLARRDLPPASMLVRDHALVIAEALNVIAIPLR